MKRKTLAVVAGAVVAFGLIALLEMAGNALYPLPAGLDFHNPEHLKVYAAIVPTGALWCVFGAYVIATFAGSWLAVVIAREQPTLMAAFVAAVVLVPTIANLILIPHPVWFAVTCVVGIPFAAFCASVLARKDPRL